MSIVIKNLNLKYDDKLVLKDINFTLDNNKTLSIIGTSGSGKTSLVKALNGDAIYDGSIKIDGTEVRENPEILKQYVAVVYKDFTFMKFKVRDEFRYYLENLNITKEEIENRIDEINEYFDINRLLSKDVELLSLNDKILVKVLSYAIAKPRYIFIDDLLKEMDVRTKILLLNYLNSNDIILINVTSDMEDVLYTDYVICLYNGVDAIDGNTCSVLENEKLLKRLGFELPFIVDLSMQLKLYGLVDKIYYNKESLEDDLWK